MRRLVAALAVALLATQSWAQPQALRDRFEAAKYNVVAVSAVWNSANLSESGVGVIVSKTAAAIIVTTPGHVVAKRVEARPGTFVVADNVTVKTASGKVLQAKVRSVAPGSNEDIAFLEIAGNSDSGLFVSAITASSETRPTAQAWLFGGNDKWEFQGGTGTVKSVSGPLTEIDGIAGVAGQSGAPIVTVDGLIGFYLGLEAAASNRVLRVGDAVRIAARLGVPWDLTPSGWVLRSVAANFQRADPFQSTVTLKHVRSGAEFPVPGTYTIPTGEYVVMSNIALITCRPVSTFISDANPDARIVVECNPNLTGNWENNRMLLLMTPAGFREFRGVSVASMADPSRAFELTLFPTAPDGFNASGKFNLQSGEFTGTATVSRDLKTLTLKLKSVSGDLVEETLRR